MIFYRQWKRVESNSMGDEIYTSANLIKEKYSKIEDLDKTRI